MSATFTTGASPLHADIALMLSAPFPEKGERGVKVTVSLDGGIPLSDLSFDPMNGLSYFNGSPVDFQGPVIKPITMPVARLPRAPTVVRFDQFADVSLDPNSLYWIEVSVSGEAEVNWGMTNDVSGPCVASNYLAWFGTDDGFFLNRGVRPFLADNTLKMEVEAAPEPSTWLTMALGFAGLGFLARRGARGAVPA
jgi:PEP-CTERM motif